MAANRVLERLLGRDTVRFETPIRTEAPGPQASTLPHAGELAVEL